MYFGQASSLARDIKAVSAGAALAALALLLVVSAGAAWWVERRPTAERSWLAWFSGFGSLALILAVTVFRDGIAFSVDPGGIDAWSTAGLRRLLRDPVSSSQFILNVILFMPAGSLWTWLTRRPLRVGVALAATSLGIESFQAVTGAGAADAGDLVANSLGAAAGALFAALLSIRSGDGQEMPAGRTGILGIATGIVLLVVTAGIIVGASQRQSSVEQALRHEFADTTREEIEARLETNPNTVFGTVSDFADASYSSETAVEIRYPANFLGIRRCVYVIWTAADVEFVKASGRSCTSTNTSGFAG